jgi:hypothetical protein
MMTDAKLRTRVGRFGLILTLASIGGACGSENKPTADAGAGADSSVDTGPGLSFAWDWNGIVGTGQSLSVGGGPAAGAIQPAAKTQPYGNLKLALNGAVVPPFDPALTALAMAPLTEPIRPTDPNYPSAYPGNLDGETPHTAMADQITRMAMDAGGQDYVSVHTVVGESGMPMTVIKKNGTFPPPGQANVGTGGRAYAATLFEVAAIARIAREMGKTYGVGAVLIIHGEADAGNTAYASDLFQLFSDYNADLPTLTGQTTKIPLLVSQQNAVPAGLSSVAISAVQQWKAGVGHPGEVICIGPKYQYDYSGDSTRVHLSSLEYEKVGEKAAQVYFERVVRGNDWQPLQPTTAEVNDNVVTVHFHVPVPPLVWDDNLAPPHVNIAEWASGRGFEVATTTARQTITSVDIVGDDSVQITCRDSLAGLQLTVGYAATSDGRVNPSGGTFRWGHLKDSDPFVGSVTGAAQPNWAVAFQMPAP